MELLNLPPQAIDAEKSLLGAVFLDNKILRKIELQFDDFYRQAHKIIFKAIQELYVLKTEIDFITLTDHLLAQGKLEVAGGSSYFSQIAIDTPTSANFKYHEAIIKEKSDRRKYIALARKVIDTAQSGELEEVRSLIAQGNKEIRQVTKLVTSRDVASGTLEYCEKVTNSPGHIIGIPSGFDDLDKQTGGWQAGEVCYIGGRPGSGKSAFAVNCIDHMGDNGRRAGIFSIEMSLQQLGVRHLAGMMRVDSKKLRLGTLSDYEQKALIRATGTLAEQKHIYCFESRLTLDKFIQYSEEMVEEYEVECIWLDYLQLISHKLHSRNREAEIAEISRTIKILSGHLGIPINVLIQLNRACQNEKRYPMISDCRESGGIEQDADIVIFLHNDKIYQVGKELDPIGVARAIIAKGRQLEIGMIKLAWEPTFTRFSNLEWREDYASQRFSDD